MTATATAPRTITHAIVSPLVTFEVKAGRSLGRWYDGRDYRSTATEVREYVTYGLFRDAMPRRFALVGTEYIELCKRCDGTGNYSSTLHDSVCLACLGSGHDSKSFADASALDKAMTTWGRGVRTTSNKAEAKYNARQAQIAAWRTEHTAMVAWVDGLVPSNTYIADGHLYGQAGYVTMEEFSQFGHTASAMITAVRDGSDLDWRETAYLAKVMASAIERTENNTSRFAGDIASKITVTGTVTLVKEIDGAYGTSLLIVVTGTGDDADVTVKTFTTSKSAWDLETGDTVTVTATVKSHETYRDTAQTMVTRAKFTRV